MGDVAFGTVLFALAAALLAAVYWTYQKKEESRRLQLEAIELLRNMNAAKLRRLLGNVRPPP